jgi:hypothetical protein
VTIAELFLQEDHTVEAETFINRASVCMHAVTDWALQLRFKVTATACYRCRRPHTCVACLACRVSPSAPQVPMRILD